MSSTTPQFEIPTDMRKMTEQSMEQARTAINAYLQFFQRGVPGNVMGGSALSDKVPVMPSAMSRALSNSHRSWCR